MDRVQKCNRGGVLKGRMCICRPRCCPGLEEPALPARSLAMHVAAAAAAASASVGAPSSSLHACTGRLSRGRAARPGQPLAASCIRTSPLPRALAAAVAARHQPMQHALAPVSGALLPNGGLRGLLIGGEEDRGADGEFSESHRWVAQARQLAALRPWPL